MGGRVGFYCFLLFLTPERHFVLINCIVSATQIRIDLNYRNILLCYEKCVRVSAIFT